MAQVFRAMNQNTREFMEKVGPGVEFLRRRYIRWKPIMRVVSVLVLMASVVLVGLVLFKRGFVAETRDMVNGIFGGWAESLWEIGTGGKSIFHLAIMLVCRAVALVFALFVVFSYPLTPVCLLLTSFFCGRWAFFKIWKYYSPFDEDAAIEWVVAQMDDETKRDYAGIKGERKASEIVSKLDDDCVVFENLEIQFDGGRNEADLIVISPSGVTVVEVKNYSGVLFGDLSDDQWEREKNSRGEKYLYQFRGEKKIDKVDSPVKQVGAPVRRLTQYLKSQGISVNIRSCALFVNENVGFCMSDQSGLAAKCPLFALEECEEKHMEVSEGRRGWPAFMSSQSTFLPYLYNQEEKSLSDQEIQQITRALSEQM